MENQLQLWMHRVNFQFQLIHHIAATGNLHWLTSLVHVIFADSLTPGTEPLPHHTEHLLHHMELRSRHMELQNQPMEHLRPHMELQSLRMRHLFRPTKPQNPPTEHQSLPTEHQSLLITAQRCQHQCTLHHLPSTEAHPTERPPPQWCKLPMSGGDQQNNLDNSIGMERTKELC